jgi:hypothetical protein
MRNCKRTFKVNSSGQVLIVAALTVAVLISSTTIYVYELSRQTNNIDSSPVSDYIFALKQGTTNALISSLANTSKGGEKAVLEVNLNSLSQAFRNSFQIGICYLSFTVINDSKYDSGVCLSWNTDGLGVSSASANFTLNVQGTAANAAVKYAVNITTTVMINGSYTNLESEEKLVNLTCRVFNEREDALAKNVTLFYENLGLWIPVDSSNNPIIIDYGNGTYSVSFNASISSDVQISACVYDLRDIYVQANTTCTEA